MQETFAEPNPDCPLCPRLVKFRDNCRKEQPTWFNSPVPSFGGLDAQLLIVGLAPGLRGANKTGRPFTGDFAGDLLYETLHKFGFSTGFYAKHNRDDLSLLNCRICNAVRCVPPQNKPIGAEVNSGDILIGKITPKGESDPTPEEKLLRAIFGDKAGDVKDASLKAPPSLKGIVIDKKLFTRTIKDKRKRNQDKEELEKLENSYDTKFEELKNILVEKLFSIVNGKTCQGITNDLGEEILPKGKKYTLKLLSGVEDYTHLTKSTWTTSDKTNKLIADLIHNYKIKENDLQGALRREKFTISVGDELPAGVKKLAKVYIAKKRKLKVGDKMAGRHGNKGIVARIVREEEMPFLEDGTPVDIVLNPLGVPSRMNIGQIYETVLGWAGQKLGEKYSTPIFDGATIEEINSLTNKAKIPQYGHTYLYDGGTGERFDQPATVGVIYMLKLGHMVDDKMHSRSIGPYSLITQQPLGGKAQFGGQRFGEMEVWALEAYGASSALQEILTVKSDDVIGRAKTYESIVKGENLPEAGLPESFNVLMHELKGLGLDIRLEEK